MTSQSGLKTSALAIVLLMLLSSSLALMNPNPVAAELDSDFFYQVEGSHATVTGYAGSGGDIVIPATLGGYDVTAIGNEAFQSFTSINSVTMPETLLSIGDGAFGYCSGLTSFDVPDSVVHIGTGAFQYCISLTSVYLGSHLLGVDQNTFYYCTSLTSIIIPDSVATIGDEAFSHCTSLTSALMGTGVTVIGNGAFSSCTALTLVNPGNNVKSIGNDAFSHCTSLTSFTFPDALSSIGSGAFSYSISLTTLHFGRSLSVLGEHTFAYCTSLSSMTFLGIIAPRTVGSHWIIGTSLGLRGHALSASDFPTPGKAFNDLTMGVAIPSEPGAPLSLVATPGNTFVALNWSAPAYDGGSNITEYIVLRSFTIDGNYTLIGSPVGRVFYDNGRQNGIVCWYKVAAINTNGIGPAAGPVSAIPGTPTAPRSFNATGSENKVTLFWLKPADDSGSDITGYSIFRVQNGVAIELAKVASYTLDYTDTTGQTGVTYAYYVQANNGNGGGSITAEVFIASTTPSNANVYFLIAILTVIVVAILVIFLVLRAKKKKALKDRNAAVVDQFDPTHLYTPVNKGPKK